MAGRSRSYREVSSVLHVDVRRGHVEYGGGPVTVGECVAIAERHYDQGAHVLTGQVLRSLY